VRGYLRTLALCKGNIHIFQDSAPFGTLDQQLRPLTKRF